MAQTSFISRSKSVDRWKFSVQKNECLSTQNIGSACSLRFFQHTALFPVHVLDRLFSKFVCFFCTETRVFKGANYTVNSSVEFASVVVVILEIFAEF
jgi:hypothetical protein